MRPLLVVAALLIAMEGDPARAMNAMAGIASQFLFCESTTSVGCGSVVLTQSQTAVGRMPTRSVQSRTMSIIEMVIEIERNSIRRLGAFARATLRDIGAKLRLLR